MKTKHIFWLLALMIALSSCGSTKIITNDSVQSDSTRIEIHTEIIEKLVHDTIYIDNPSESYKQIKDTISELYTKLAFSRAELLPNGQLLHSIKNLPYKEPIPIQYKEIEVVRDSIVYRDKDVYIKEEVPVKYIPKLYKLSFWYSLISIIGIIIFVAMKLK